MHKKGNLLGLLSGLFWGLDSVVLGIALLHPLLLKLGPNASLVATLIHDTFSFVVLMFLMIKLKKLSEFKMVLKSKAGLAIIVAAMLGGPIGMGGYILSINYLGSTLASSISAIYPAMGVALAYIFLKERMKPHSIVGLFIAILAIVMMGITPNIQITNLTLGLFFSSLAVIGWGSEVVIISAALKEDVSSEVALSIRQLTSALIYTFVVIPFIGLNKLHVPFSSPKIYLLILIAGLIGTISYLAYYKSIDLIGATQAMGLNITYPAWAFIFQYLLMGIFELRLFLMSIVVMIGSILSNDKPKEVLDIFKFKTKEAKNHGI